MWPFPQAKPKPKRHRLGRWVLSAVGLAVLSYVGTRVWRRA